MPHRLARWLEESRSPALELVGAIRDLVSLAVTALAPPDALARAAASVRAAAAELAGHVPEGSPARIPQLDAIGGPADIMPFDPVIGAWSPMAPPLVVAIDDGRATASVTFGPPYGGPPGCVHGGVIAACFDQVLNVANLLAGVAGPTASLEVRYRKPTPLGQPLRFEAGTPVVDGRQVRTTGVLRDGDTVLAEATGVFVTLPADRVMDLTSGRR
jgi:acyl-coenzyme A thioesterase PaaI-like protein